MDTEFEIELNTKKYEPIIEEIIVDDRENNRIDLTFSLYTTFNVKCRRLLYGDYVFMGYNGCKVGFEFKTADDFLSSIDDSDHLHNQVWSMVNRSGYDFCFVIVVGDVIKQTLEREDTINRVVSVPHINGVLSDVLLSCPVCICSTDIQAFDLMMRIAGKFIQNKNVKYKYHRKHYNSALNLLSCIHGLDSKAELIVDTLNLHTVADVLKLTKEQLVTVDGIGDVTAENILAEIKR